MELIKRPGEGKIPPQAIELEESVLGAMMIDKRGLVDGMDILSGEMFYKEQHKLIFESMRELYINSNPVDLRTISNQLKKSENLDLVGGAHYLVGLSQVVASSANIEYHARIVIQKFVLRQIISNASELIEKSYNETADTFDILDQAYSHLNSIAEVSIKPQEVLFSEVVDKQIERGRKIYNKEIEPGLATPIVNITNRTGGWRNSELIILAARPGMGKTAFVLSCGLIAAKKGNPVAYFSLEMSKEKLTDRLLAMEGKIDGNKFNIHGLNLEDQEKLKPVADEFNSLPFYIDDTSSLTIEQFQIKAKRLKSKYGIKLIILDYLQLMSGKGNNREQEISKISRGLKIVSKDLNIPVIALSQLSRAVETRGGNKRPQLSDLRESGAIEQDADMVTFLYRPEYYGFTEWDDEERSPCGGQAEFIAAKNRNGGLGVARMNWEGRYTLFSNYDPDEYIPALIENMNPDDNPF